VQFWPGYFLFSAAEKDFLAAENFFTKADIGQDDDRKDAVGV
jgi:hypothetical protein